MTYKNCFSNFHFYLNTFDKSILKLFLKVFVCTSFFCLLYIPIKNVLNFKVNWWLAIRGLVGDGC